MYQSDAVLQQGVHAAKAKEQRVVADTDESGEAVCLDKSESEEASPKADTPVANTRSRVGSSPCSLSALEVNGVSCENPPTHFQLPSTLFRILMGFMMLLVYDGGL